MWAAAAIDQCCAHGSSLTPVDGSKADWMVTSTKDGLCGRWSWLQRGVHLQLAPREVLAVLCSERRQAEQICKHRDKPRALINRKEHSRASVGVSNVVTTAASVQESRMRIS